MSLRLVVNDEITLTGPNGTPMHSLTEEIAMSDEAWDAHLVPRKTKRKSVSAQLKASRAITRALQERISELEDELSNETKRADEAVDELETLKYDIGENYKHVEYDSTLFIADEQRDALNLISELKTCQWRADLGVTSAADRAIEIQSELLTFDSMELCV